jgi:hypothetical protein
VAGDFGRDIVFACLTKGFDRRTNAPIIFGHGRGWRLKTGRA